MFASVYSVLERVEYFDTFSHNYDFSIIDAVTLFACCRSRRILSRLKKVKSNKASET